MTAISNPTRWRTHPQKTLFYAAFVQPVVVMKRRVNQATFTYPVTQITYDNPDGWPGVYQSVQKHMTLAVYNEDETVLRGLVRVRFIATPTLLYIAETAQGDLPLADNDVLVVLDDYRLWALTPRLQKDGAIFKDYNVACMTNTTTPPPIANLGPAYAGWADPVTGKATVSFSASGSFPVAAGATLASFTWELGDGIFTVGDEHSENVTVEYEAGQRWAELRVIDSNGQLGNARTPVLVFDDDHPPTAITQVRLSGEPGGWSASFEVLASDVSALLPGTMVILFTDEFFGDVKGTVNGIPGREHIKFVGWVTSDMSRIEPSQDTLQVTAQGPMGRLASLPAYGQSLTHVAGATSSWLELRDLTVWSELLYLIQWHSTAWLVCDLERPGWYGDYPQKYADISGGTLAGQWNEEAERVSARVSCDKAGRLLFRRMPQRMPNAERLGGTLVTTALLGALDWRDEVMIRRDHQAAVKWMRGSALTCSHTTPAPVLATAPGGAPGQGSGEQTLDGLLVMDQAELNETLGHAYAYETRDIQEVSLTLNHAGGGFDPAWGDIAKFTLDSLNKLGLAWTLAPFVPVRMEVTHDGETLAVTERLTLEPLSGGVYAVTEPVPTDDYKNTQPPPSHYDRYDPDEPPPSYGPGTGSCLMGINAWVTHLLPPRGVVVYTNSGSDGPWVKLHGGLPADGSVPSAVERLAGINLDPYDPNRAIVAFQYGGVFSNTSWTSGGTWTELVDDITLLAAINSATGFTYVTLRVDDMALTMAQQGTIYLACAVDSGTFADGVVVKLTNWGASLSVSPRLVRSSGEAHRMLNYLQVVAGCVNANFFAVTATPSDYFLSNYQALLWAGVWGSVGSGGKWTPNVILDQTEDNFVGNVGLQIPYKKADGTINDDSELYWFGPGKRIYRSTNGGASVLGWSDLGQYPQAKGVHDNYKVPPLAVRDTFELAAQPGQLAFMIQADAAGDKLLIGGPTEWTTKIITPITANHVGWAGGWPATGGQFYAGASRYGGADVGASKDTPVVCFTHDGGDSWQDWTHNLWSLTPLNQTNPPYMAGVVRLTPHWLEG